MPKLERSVIALISWIVLAGSGACVRFVGPEEIRQDLSKQAGVKLKQETGFTVTRSGIWLARAFTDEDELPLKGVRRVEVGVYEVRGLRRGVDAPHPLQMDDLEGWQKLVHLREPGEEVFVLTKLDDEERIRGMLVVVADEDEWVLVRIRGKLDRVFEQAMGMAFDNAERPELYARTRQERGLDDEELPEDSSVEPMARSAAGARRSTSFGSQE